MSRPGYCDRCGARFDHHKWDVWSGHDFTCAADDATREMRKARRHGANVYIGYASWRTHEAVDGCMGTGCLRGRHGRTWSRHEYEAPPPAVLLERMHDRRAARILRRVTARGTWAYATVYMVWLDDADVLCDDWDVTRTYGDWTSMLTVTRERLGISRFVVPEQITPRQWSMYSDREGVTVVIERRVVGTLVRP